mgnify:CR=1 FL=1
MAGKADFLIKNVGFSRAVRVGNLVVDLPHHAVLVDGAKLDLTPKEFGFLALLARHPGRVLTHRTILQAVWGEGYGTETLPRLAGQHALYIENQMRAFTRRERSDEDGEAILEEAIAKLRGPRPPLGTRPIGVSCSEVPSIAKTARSSSPRRPERAPANAVMPPT